MTNDEELTPAEQEMRSISNNDQMDAATIDAARRTAMFFVGLTDNGIAEEAALELTETFLLCFMGRK